MTVVENPISTCTIFPLNRKFRYQQAEQRFILQSMGTGLFGRILEMKNPIFTCIISLPLRKLRYQQKE